MFLPEKPFVPNRSWLDRLNLALRKFSRATRRRRRKPSAELALSLERLEDRSLLSAFPGDPGAPPNLGGTSFVFNPNGTLTSFASDQQPLSIAQAYLQSHYSDLGLSSADVSNLLVSRQYTTHQTGETYLTFEQSQNGIPVFASDMNATVLDDGRILSLGNRAIPGLQSKLVAGSPTITASDAVTRAAQSLGLSMTGSLDVKKVDGGAQQKETFANTSISRLDIPAELDYRLAADGKVHLAWYVQILKPDFSDYVGVFVDAQTGTVLESISNLEHLTPNPVPNSGSLRVFDAPLKDPTLGSRTLVVNPADAVASPLGWNDTGLTGGKFTDTRGNNSDAAEDLNADFNPGARPNGGASLTFDFPVNLNSQPTTFTQGSTTNLFYWMNTIHDIFYHYGFDEAAGNFQENNFGKGGIGNDRVQGLSQFGAGIPFNLNNAFFVPTRDGVQPFFVMGLFDNPGGRTLPPLDTDLANQVIIHEFGHGVSNRLTGNASGLFAQQSGGMGEGWSDWWSNMLLQQATDKASDPVLEGSYLVPGGIRIYPYSFDMTVDPHTYGDYNLLVTKNGAPGYEVHNAGEIWASALWDMNWLLINKYGFSSNLYSGYSPGAAGNILAMQLVMDGLKIQPINPSFLDARNAILAADIALTGGQNQFEIWEAFARRGMGLSASDGGSANSLNVTEAFDLPFTVIQGTKFNDVNGNGQRGGTAEVGLRGWTIYDDKNGNGVRDQTQQTYAASGLPMNIRDTTTINVPVTVTGMPGFVQDVNVTLDITHPYDADMDVYLVAPSGKKVELFTDIGANLANFTNTTLDDSASTSIKNARAPFTGTFRPEGRLSDFIGENPNGQWTLQVTDDAPRDSGTLNSWSLQLTAGENSVPTDINGNYSLIVPGGGTYTVAEEQQLGWQQTAPAAPGTRTVTLTTFTIVTGQDFGNQTSTNSNPVVTLPTGTGTYLENGPPLPIDSKGIVTDADSPNFNGGVLTVSITANGTVDDRLEITNQGTAPGQIGLSGSNVTFGGTVIGTFTGGVGTNPLIVTFNTNATAPLITALLRQITFRVASDTPSQLPRTVSVQVTDGSGGVSNVATAIIQVVAQNDPPVNTVPTSTLNVLRNVAISFTVANAVSVADPDIGTSSMLVTLSATNGTLSLGSTTGLTFSTGDGLVDTTMVFTGTLTNVNAALATLSYISNQGYVGPATITITSNDQGASGTGGPQTDSDTINLTVGNLPPTLTTIGTLNGAIEDTDFVITHSALSLVSNANDPNFDPISFRIEAISSGTLTKNGVPVSPQSTLLGPNESVVWHPAANANGVLPAFTVRATDGMFFTDPPVQVTVNVTPVPDAPTLTTVNPLSKAAAAFPFAISFNQLAAVTDAADADGDPLIFRVESVTNGTLTKNSLPVSPGSSTVSNGESLVWTAAPGTQGTISAFTIVAVDPTGLVSSPAVSVPIVTVISTPPSLTSVSTLSSAPRNGFIDISYNQLKNSSNASDPEGDTLTFRVESLLSGALSKNGVSVVPGTTTLGPGETWRYTPLVGTNGLVDAFTVTVSDGVFFTNPPVKVQVNVVNTAPTLSTISTLSSGPSIQLFPNPVVANEDQPFTITQPMLGAASDASDINGDTVNYVIVKVLSGTLTQNGLPVIPLSTVLDAAHGVVWTPPKDANGVLDAFTVLATDGNLASSKPVKVSVNVIPVNDAPTLSNINTIINGIETLPFDFTYQILKDASNAADVDNPTISFRVESILTGTLLKDGVPVVAGQTTVGPNEKFVWVPPPGAVGQVATFTVTAFDGSLSSGTPVTVLLDMSPLGLTRMYRAYNPAADYHFFTLSTVEFTAAVQHGYRDETSGRPGFSVPVLQLAGTTAIHRLRNPNNGRHYYTGSDSERDFLRGIGWIYEKDEGAIFTQPVAGSVEIFRLYNTRTGTHLFTEDMNTKNSILALYPGVWVQHTSLGYAFSVGPSSSPIGVPTVTSPNHASARSSVSTSTRSVTPELPASEFTVSSNNSSLTPDQPVLNPGRIASATVSMGSRSPLRPTDERIATDRRNPMPQSSSRSAQLSGSMTELLDQVWVEVGQNLILGTNRLIDSDG